MNNNSILNKVRELLGMEIKLAERRLEDGQTRIEAEEFAAGFQVVIVTEDDQRIPLPEGEYKLDGDEGEILVIQEEGIIFEIKKEEVVEEEVTEEVEVKEEVVEEEMATEKPAAKKTVESIVKETFFSEIENLKKENEELKAEVEHLSKVNNKEESTEKVVEEVVELSEEAAVKPISHNPENEQKTNLKAYSQNRPQTTQDRVFAKLSK